MKKYIESGWLLELYTMGGDESAVQNYHVPVPMILETINAPPAADVVEVRHGQWEKVIPTKSAAKWSTKVSCSQCHGQGYERYNYCPHCGALMDKEE